MGSEMAGKCAFPLRRKPRRHQWVVGRREDNHWGTRAAKRTSL